MHAQFFAENSELDDEEWLKICSGMENLMSFTPSRRTARLELDLCDKESMVFLSDKGFGSN